MNDKKGREKEIQERKQINVIFVFFFDFELEMKEIKREQENT